MFLRTFFVLAAAALIGVRAAASSAVDINAPAIVGTKETEFGTLTFYGRAADDASELEARLNEDCGPQDVYCLQEPDRAPNAQACQLLITALHFLPPFDIEWRTHAVCAGLDNHAQCCVSWLSTGAGLQSTDLVPAAQRIFSQCVAGGGRGGTATGVKLKGVCTRECVAENVDHCVPVPIWPPYPPPPPPHDPPAQQESTHEVSQSHKPE